MSAYRIDILQFMQEITASVLGLQGINYIRAVTYDRQLEFSNWPAIVYAVMCLCREIYRSHKSHVLSVLSFVNKSGQSQTYVDRLGDRLFNGREFSWNMFRGFLAVIIQMSFFSYREDQIFLSDDFVTSASIYINSSLQRHIDDHHGWKTFQLDCVLVVVRGKKEEEPSPNPASHSSEVTPSTSRRSATMAKMVSFRIETYGKMYTFDSEKNALVLDPVDLAGQSSEETPSTTRRSGTLAKTVSFRKDPASFPVKPRQLKSWQMDTEQPACLVGEIIKISEEVLESMTTDYVQQIVLETITIDDMQQDVLEFMINENVQQGVLESMPIDYMQQYVLESMTNDDLQLGVLVPMTNDDVQLGVLELITNDANVLRNNLELMTSDSVQQGTINECTGKEQD